MKNNPISYQSHILDPNILSRLHHRHRHLRHFRRDGMRRQIRNIPIDVTALILQPSRPSTHGRHLLGELRPDELGGGVFGGGSPAGGCVGAVGDELKKECVVALAWVFRGGGLTAL